MTLKLEAIHTEIKIPSMQDSITLDFIGHSNKRRAETDETSIYLSILF